MPCLLISSGERVVSSRCKNAACDVGLACIVLRCSNADFINHYRTKLAIQNAKTHCWKAFKRNHFRHLIKQTEVFTQRNGGIYPNKQRNLYIRNGFTTVFSVLTVPPNTHRHVALRIALTRPTWTAPAALMDFTRTRTSPNDIVFWLELWAFKIEKSPLWDACFLLFYVGLYCLMLYRLFYVVFIPEKVAFVAAFTSIPKTKKVPH